MKSGTTDVRATLLDLFLTRRDTVAGQTLEIKHAGDAYACCH